LIFAAAASRYAVLHGSNFSLYGQQSMSHGSASGLNHAQLVAAGRNANEAKVNVRSIRRAELASLLQDVVLRQDVSPEIRGTLRVCFKQDIHCTTELSV
jgi:hypothetical protein